MKNRLEEIRKQRGIKQDELAEAMGVSRQTISSLENGRYNPSVILAIKLARYFGLNVEDIYREAFNMEYSQMNVLKNDIKEKFKLAKATFSDDDKKIASLSEEDKEELRLFSFICELSFDVYLKKLLIEKLCDSISEEK